MKIYDIALFLFLFNMGFSMLSAGTAFATPNGNATGLGIMCGIGQGTVYTYDYANSNFSCNGITPSSSANYQGGQDAYETYKSNSGDLQTRTNSTQPDAKADPIGALTSGLNVFYTMIIGGVLLIMDVLWKSTFGVFTMFEILGVPHIISYPICIIVIFLYFFGLAQLITGKSTREYQ